MKSIPLASITGDTYFTDNVFLDESFQLLDKSVPLTTSMKKAMADWSFTSIYTDGNQRSADTPAAPKDKQEAAAAEEKKEIPQNVSYESVDINDLLGLPQQESPAIKVPKAPPVPDLPDIAKGPTENVGGEDSIDDMFASMEESKAEAFAVEATAEEQQQADSQKLDEARNAYNSYLEYVDEVYTRYATHKELDYKQISERIKEMILFIRDNQSYILRIIPSDREKEKNFLVSHSLRSTVLAIIIGETLQMQAPKLISLGIACLVHEIGQIRLPPQLYMTDRLLTAPEKVQMAKHPIIGYNILKEHNFPLAVQLGVLDHHERENGNGYPRHIKGDKITSFAKIISVACSFEAITAPRLFREERSAYEAMLEMLKNHDGAYDETVIKALLRSLSLFPIGAYVQLANGKIAQVVDVTPGQPKCPKVKLIDKEKTEESPASISTDTAENKIVRVLNKIEVAKIKGTN